MALLLASKSPRRRELFQLITPFFEVADADVDEAALTAQSPVLLAQVLARAKAEAVFLAHPQQAVVGCDTVVEVGGQTLGKPHTEQQATQMLQALSGRWHAVHTGVCIMAPGARQPAALFAETTQVEFAEIPPAEIARYVKTAEPYDKAGAYGIQGFAARYVPRINGCYYNVMGLPVAALYGELKRLSLL
ncbi:MAG: Maf family protein [Oscillospiraceae bacterium]